MVILKKYIGGLYRLFKNCICIFVRVCINYDGQAVPVLS